MKSLGLLLGTLFFAVAAQAQYGAFNAFSPTPVPHRPVLIEGNLAFLKGQHSIKAEYNYNNMQVGTMKESDYVAEKVANKNGRDGEAGDEWKNKWEGNRQSILEPNFEQALRLPLRKYQINASREISENGHQYRMEVHTVFTDPGFNFGFSAYAMKGATAEMVVTFYDKNAPDKVLARVKIFGTGSVSQYTGYSVADRIGSAYSAAGGALGRFIRRQFRKMERAEKRAAK